MNRPSPGLWFRTLRQARGSQILHRSLRLGRQALDDSRARVFRSSHGSWKGPSQAPALAPELPKPLFEARPYLVNSVGGATRARFSGLERALDPPIDWKPRHGLPALRLPCFQLHGMEYLESLDDALFARVVEDWMRSNPRHARRAWYAAWHPYPLSVRIVVWLQEIARRGTRLQPALVQCMTASLADQTRHLARELEHDLGGNHLVKNAKALLWCARALNHPESQRWRRRGRGLLDRILRDQLLGDGTHFERSPAYHAQVMADLLECREVLREGSLRNRLDAALDAMANALAQLTHPDGYPSQFNDGGLTMAYPADLVLRVHESRGGRPPISKAVFALGQAGFFGARDGGDLVLVDCGAIAPDALPAHGHGDALSFEWSLDGQRILVDPGSSEYEASPRRAWERSTRAHNTVTVDDADQGEFWSRFRLGRRARVVLEDYRASPSGFFLQGSHDGFALQDGAPRHERRLRVIPSAIEVEDEVRGGAGQPVRARLLLHPDVVATLDDQGCRFVRASTTARLDCPHPLRLEQAWWSPDLGHRIPTRQLVIEYGDAPCRGSFCLAAVRSGPRAQLAQERVPGSSAGEGAGVPV